MNEIPEDPRDDAFYANLAKQLRGATAGEFLKAALSGLSPQEAALAAEIAPAPTHRRTRGNLLLEVDAELAFKGRSYPLPLQVYGKIHPYHPGQSGGRGERRLSPPEPAHAEVYCVVIGNENYSVEIDAAMPEDAIDALAEAAMEECDE